MRSHLLLPVSLLPLLLVASGAVGCSVSGDEDIVAQEAATTSRYSPYPFELRALRRLDGITPKNFTILDPRNEVRDQGRIGSCASHGFLGMIENRMYVDRGISLDLSERYMLYANFMDTGNMGNAPEVIVRFAEIAATWGVMPETSFPYAELAPNAHRFQLDSAQGLANDPNALTIDDAVKGTANATQERSRILEDAKYLGALPAGPYPIELPVKAKLTDDARVPEIELGTKIVACFSPNGPEGLPEEKRLRVTPREFAAMCLDLGGEDTFGCRTDLAAITAPFEGDPSLDPCTSGAMAASVVGHTYADVNQKRLALTTALVARGEAVLLGVQVPAEDGAGALWRGEGLGYGGGHAVVAVGYVSAADLAKPEEQARGLLGSGIFDALAKRHDPAYPIDALPTDPAVLRDVRLGSAYGQAVAKEGGLVLFRNSWGPVHGDVEIGARGYQSMTFDFFMKSTMLVSSRRRSVPGVDFTAGEACPSFPALPSSDPWIARDHSRELVSFFQDMAMPPECRP